MELVLLAYDGSECSRRALDYAIAFAGRVGARVHVLTVEQEPRIYGEIAVYAQLDQIRQALENAGKALVAEAVTRFAAAGVAHETEVVVGDPARVIAERADALGCTQIIMGSRGHGNLANLLLGSVASKVLHHSSLPVTLVR